MKKELLKEKFYSFLIGIITCGWYNYVYRSSHKEMTVENTNAQLYVPYSYFEKKFHKQDWKTNPQHKNSLFSIDNHNTFLHAGVYSFNNIGTVLTTYGYYRSRKLMKENISRINRQNYLNEIFKIKK